MFSCFVSLPQYLQFGKHGEETRRNSRLYGRSGNLYSINGNNIILFDKVNKQIDTDFRCQLNQAFPKNRSMLCGVESGQVKSSQVKSSQVKSRQGKARQGKARQGKARQGIARQGKARQGKARQGKARQGKARQGKARQGKARHGTARHGTARQGRAGQVRSGQLRSGQIKSGQGTGTGTGTGAGRARQVKSAPTPGGEPKGGGGKKFKNCTTYTRPSKNAAATFTWNIYMCIFSQPTLYDAAVTPAAVC